MKYKVLIVDGEQISRKIPREIIGNFCSTEEAASIDEAIGKLENFKADIILTNIKLPDGTGTSLIEKLKSFDTEIAFIIMADHHDITPALEALDLGAFDVIKRPFEEADILSSIKKAERFIKLNDELVKAKNQSLEAEKMASLGMMAGGIAHEINTPLGAILLNTQLLQTHLQRGTTDLETLRKPTANIKKVVEHLACIVRSLKNYSRDSYLDPLEEIELNDIVENVLYLCKNKLRKTNVIINVSDIQDKQLKVQCRPSEIIQVLVNLINNACDAIEGDETKWIQIKASEVESGFNIRVEDSGTSLDDSKKHSIFQPFFTSKEQGEGTGLGLYVARSLIEGHNGTIDVDLSRGHTVFVIKLPKATTTETFELAS